MPAVYGIFAANGTGAGGAGLLTAVPEGRILHEIGSMLN
jgi:hypothetical protein